MNIDTFKITDELTDLTISENEILYELENIGGIYSQDLGYIQGKKDVLVKLLKGYYNDSTS